MGEPIAAETLAAKMIRSALARGATPRLGVIADETALTVREVEQIRDRPLSGRRSPWRKAIGHPVPRIARKAKRIADLVASLEADLEADAALATLRAKEEKLAQQLAAVRAELKAGPSTTVTREGRAKVPCPDCGTPVANLGVHRAKSAKHRQAVDS